MEKSVLVKDWQVFYDDVFGIKVDFSDLVIPEKRVDFDRLVIVVQELRLQRFYDKCEALFPCYKWTDDNLDLVVKSERISANGLYAVWIRDRVEADEELKNLSTYDLIQQKVAGITLEERLVYELKYFKETGKHLDVRNVTLCTGSVAAGGIVFVGFYNGKMRVRCCYIHNHNNDLRSRQVIY